MSNTYSHIWMPNTYSHILVSNSPQTITIAHWQLDDHSLFAPNYSQLNNCCHIIIFEESLYIGSCIRKQSTYYLLLLTSPNSPQLILAWMLMSLQVPLWEWSPINDCTPLPKTVFGHLRWLKTCHEKRINIYLF